MVVNEAAKVVIISKLGYYYLHFGPKMMFFMLLLLNFALQL